MIHVIGEILVDVIQSDNKKEVFAGGAPFNVASNIKHFGGHCSFYGSIGKDEYGLFLKKYARGVKFDSLLLSTPKNRKTTQAFVTLNNGERSFKFIRDFGADYCLSIARLKKLNINKDDIVHLGSLMLSEPRGRSFFFKAIKYIKRMGAKISFDINYREDIFKSPLVAKRVFKRAIKDVDYLKMSYEEVFILSKYKNIKTCLSHLLSDDQIAFITNGKEGSFVYHKDIVCSASTFEVTPIDTTGAGDAFYSYVLYSLDNKETKYGLILKNANAVGAIATLKKGATGVVPTIKELNNYLKEKEGLNQ